MKRMKVFSKVGMRTTKSAVAVGICFIVYALRGYQGMPFYSALSALWCMMPDIENSRKMALQRTIGTMIGAAYGLLALLLYLYVFPNMTEIGFYFFSAVMIVPIISTTVAYNKQNATYFSCVVFLSITINHFTDVNPFLFVWGRILDTMIGILVALAVNSMQIPHKKHRDTLFVVNLDEILPTENHSFSPFSKRELNRMLKDGLKLTFATVRTPASVLKQMRDISLNLPIIAMDGAVVFDLKENTILKTNPMKYEVVKEVTDFFEEGNIHYFVNATLQDTLFIYYNEFKNEVEEQLYHNLKVSPYRNYIKGYPTDKENTVYIMVLVETEISEQLVKELKEKEFAKNLRWLHYESVDFPGYSYIKIYDRESSRLNAIEYLTKVVPNENRMVLGRKAEHCNVCTDGKSADEVTKLLRRKYEPYIWEK